jgi:hypothetical protein
MLMATLSFAHDIRAMFRDKDVQEMMDIANFDLSNYADVRAHAADIYERVADGSMPCDGAWSAEQIAKFKQTCGPLGMNASAGENHVYRKGHPGL